MDWHATLLAARLAEAAYVDDLADARNVFGALGFIALAQYKDASHQAYVLYRNDEYTLAISGTRFGRSLGDLLSDADLLPCAVGITYGEVSHGAYQGLGKLWDWAISKAPMGQQFDVVGHSLGGERALLSGLVAANRCRNVYAFEAPKCANAAAWAMMSKHVEKSVCVVNGKDLWAGWPLVSEWSHPPVQHYHLLDEGFAVLAPGVSPEAIDPGDHDIALVVKRLAQICNTIDATSVMTS